MTDKTDQAGSPATNDDATSSVPALAAQEVNDQQARPPHRSKRRNRCLIPVACVTAFILVTNAAITLLLMQWRAPQMVSFDMQGTVNQFMSQVSSGHLSDEQVKATTARFNTALDAALNDYQQQHGALILVAPAVVGGVPDITDTIQSAVADTMSE
ncbi:type-F conjugative transfer system protein TrbI [Klebsiella aerogenes]|uniref:type-F conjugative transfer system protein TrbI n=1 Tax=Klebsiella aerogenes TaxID=548 RepID=UPI000DA1C484|nr:type-F conjugative transfer system protein TrbI [Klebsiella aerogenes]HCB2859844.1 type-F conjugative transfer system protein TrbI [Klebsiella aerogenes]HCB2864847.1 type-F conjugative transfer system protein TrbI [Klebsiella aerogenes]HCB2880481.1 type-F conjugative transfer system protein TrbI [Klebsiella aerogenes]HCB3345910.1 type-F conjugative transfer system protein TrbI [Klebsiella aerogenes]HCM1811912.1 type-F conjugative transfer system protein TrbI [Klebsiella aerogenes]